MVTIRTEETTMSALTPGRRRDYGDGWEGLLALWEDTDAPEGCRVELVEGTVTVAPPPSKSHNAIAEEVQRQLHGLPRIGTEFGIHQTLGLALPIRSGIFVPDLAVVPRAAVRGPGTHVVAGEAALGVEVTSKGNAGQDRVTKAAAYAQEGAPLYLLVDCWATDTPGLVLYGEPEAGVYRTLW
ncbi:Uma2 family endonuclease, partial [Streptomyces alkaliphilus]